MDAPRHGPPEMSFLRKNEKVNEQKVPCLDAKMSYTKLVPNREAPAELAVVPAAVTRALDPADKTSVP